MGYQGVILDVDGTLVDSNDAHALAWRKAINEAGFSVPFDEVRQKIGMGGDHLLPALVGPSADAPIAQSIEKRRAEIFQREFLPTLKAFPAAGELVDRLNEEHYFVVVGSSADPNDLDALLKQTELKEKLPQRLDSGDVRRSKPEPDIIKAALDRMALPPSRVVLIGDTPYDIEAATRAGVATIAVRSGGWSDQQLRGAIAIYQDVATLLEEFDGSPLGDGTRYFPKKVIGRDYNEYKNY